MLTATINNWSNCNVLCVKKGRIIGKDMTSWFSSTTTHHRTRQQWSKTIWRHSTGKCPIPLTHLVPSDYHLFSSLNHALAERHFDSYEDVRKWLNEWFVSKEIFFWRSIHKLSNRWKKYIAIDKYSYRWAILRIKYFLSFSCNNISIYKFYLYFLFKNSGFIFTYLVYLKI